MVEMRILKKSDQEMSIMKVKNTVVMKSRGVPDGRECC